MYYVYILASRRHGTLYIGVTNSLQKRLDGSPDVQLHIVFRRDDDGFGVKPHR